LLLSGYVKTPIDDDSTFAELDALMNQISFAGSATSAGTRCDDK
jgi:hypothetical protein